MNNIVIHGRLTRDPEFKALDTTGRTVCNFSVAVAKRGNSEAADFFDCAAWGKTADFIMKYFHRGKESVVSGRMESRQAVNLETGKKTTYWRIQVEAVDFCGKANDVEKAEMTRNDASQTEEIQSNEDGLIPLQDDDDLPF